MASLTVISWRDIPAQVIVRRGRETAKVRLSDRFQEAVDRAAMRAGKGSSDLYLAEWKRSSATPCSDDIEQEAAAGHISTGDAFETSKALVWMTERYLYHSFGPVRRVPPGRALETIASIWSRTLYQTS